jgi:hypothetical protein
MTPLFRSITRLFTALTIVFGVRPRIVSSLDVLQRPSVQIVAVTRRRCFDYASLFTITDPEACNEVYTYRLSAQPGRAASQQTPIHRPARRRYTPVRSA